MAELENRAEADGLEDDLDLDMMQAECMFDEDVLSFLSESDTVRPLPANKIMVPEALANQTGYVGPVYGYLREDSGYHVIIGWEGNEPAEVLMTSLIGFIGESDIDLPAVYVQGEWVGEKLAMTLVQADIGRMDELTPDIYTIKQDVFSRNSGLIETNWMDEMCAVISGCGSVGSCVALQLARSGVGRFVLIDTDCMEIHNVCRHQCNLVDVGRYKVDAVAERIYRINPGAQIKKFYQRIQEVPRERYEEWITPEKAIFIGTCDNRLGNAVACDIAYDFGAPFAALGFMTRAWAGEMYTCLPERHDICYRCAFQSQIENSIAEERRNHFYIGEEELAKGNFEPGLDVDLEFGTSLFNKVVLDILNRHNEQYSPRIMHKMTQFTIFSGTDDRTFAEPFWKKAFQTPIALRSLRHSEECRRCDHCKKAER